MLSLVKGLIAQVNGLTAKIRTRLSKVSALLSFVNGLTTFASELISLVSKLTFPISGWQSRFISSRNSVSGSPVAIRTLVIRVREEEWQMRHGRPDRSGRASFIPG